MFRRDARDPRPKVGDTLRHGHVRVEEDASVPRRQGSAGEHRPFAGGPGPDHLAVESDVADLLLVGRVGQRFFAPLLVPFLPLFHDVGQPLALQDVVDAGEGRRPRPRAVVAVPVPCSLRAGPSRRRPGVHSVFSDVVASPLSFRRGHGRGGGDGGAGVVRRHEACRQLPGPVILRFDLLQLFLFAVAHSALLFFREEGHILSSSLKIGRTIYGRIGGREMFLV
mmetsp:Transcript_27132/g.54279  ORF Transcript_27132/g.54279 Transcript_27132/m.54279 type:complete len:224 (+) Transcript_27132:344-1015(+)